MDNKKLLEDHRRMSTVRTLVRQLGISMSLLSDYSKIRAQAVTEDSRLDAPAATSRELRKAWKSKWFNLNWWMDDDDLEEDTTYPEFTVWFDPEHLPEPKGKGIGAWLGAAWHELAHILWTPWDDTQTITLGMNLLEDARIEQLLLARYDRMRGALLSVLGWLMGNEMTYAGETHQSMSPMFAWAWVAGRPHLPNDVRSSRYAEAAKVSPIVADELGSLFEEYVNMGHPLNMVRAREIVVRVDQILGTTYTDPICSGMHGGNVSDEGIEIQVSTGVIPTSGGEEGEQGMDADSEAASIQSEADSDSALEQEILEYSTILAAGSSPGNPAKWNSVAPTGRAQSMASRIRKEAGKFNDESGKGIVRKRDHGRLRPIRYEITDDLDTAYDVWDPGLDQDMWVGLCIDMSGSMHYEPLSEIVYSLQVGLNDVATVDVALFHDTLQTLPSPNTPNSMVHIVADGGTDPSDAMLYMYDRCMASSAANKLVLLYTDGTFNNDGASILTGEYLRQLLKQGVTISIMGESGRTRMESFLRYNPDLSPHTGGIEFEDLPVLVGLWAKDILTKQRPAW